MDLSEFTVKLLLLGIPGLIAYLFSRCFVVQKEPSVHVVILNIFLSTIAAYALLTLLLVGYGAEWEYVISVLLDDNKRDRYELLVIILAAAAIGYVLALIYGAMFTYNIPNRIGKSFKITKKFGDIDVWHFFHNSNHETEWIYVRDLKTNLTYYGCIILYSDSGEDRELLMYNVSVFKTDSGDKCYEVAHLYLSRNIDDLTIEIPNPITNNIHEDNANDQPPKSPETPDRRNGKEGGTKSASGEFKAQQSAACPEPSEEMTL